MSADGTTLRLDLPEHDESEDHEHRVELVDLIRIGVIAVAALLTLLLPALPIPALVAFGSVVLVFGAWPVLHEAASNLRKRLMTMELSMTIALLSTLSIF